MCIAGALSEEITDWAQNKFDEDSKQDMYKTLFKLDDPAEDRADKLLTWLNSDLYQGSKKSLLNSGVDICYLLKNLLPSLNSCKTPADFAMKMEGVNNEEDVKNLFVGELRGFPIGRIKGEHFEMKLSTLVYGSWLASARSDVNVFLL